MTTITNMPMFRAIALMQALKFYAETKMRVNRAYTPSRMLQVATEITGIAYKRGQYLKAASDIREWLDARQAEGEDLQTDRQL